MDQVLISFIFLLLAENNVPVDLMLVDFANLFKYVEEGHGKHNDDGVNDHPEVEDLVFIILDVEIRP